MSLPTAGALADGRAPGPGILGLLAVTCGLTVSDIYFNQPLLPSMARDFGIADREAGLVVTLSQVGYGIGSLGVVPLGDIRERKRLILHFMGLVAAALGLAALAPTFAWLAVASLVTPSEWGRVVGTHQGALVLGVVLARVGGGTLGELLGWRLVYAMAALVMAALGVVLARTLPRQAPATSLRYAALLGSLLQLVRTKPVLRRAALVGALAFGAERGVWARLAFFLEGPPYQYGPATAGLFGLVGAAGASAAPLVGRLADRRGSAFTSVLAGIIMLAAFTVLTLGGTYLVGLALGILLLDVGMQATQTSNQARILAIRPEALSRLNTVYMAAAFGGRGAGLASRRLGLVAPGVGGRVRGR